MPRRVQLLHHHPPAVPTRHAQVAQRLLERGVLGVDEEAEDVHFVAGNVRAHLDARHQREAGVLRRGGQRLRNAFRRIVVRHRPGC